MIKTTVKDCGFPELVQAARKALENAYSPYSDYKVGAALLTENGKIFILNPNQSKTKSISVP